MNDKECEWAEYDKVVHERGIIKVHFYMILLRYGMKIIFDKNNIKADEIKTRLNKNEIK